MQSSLARHLVILIVIGGIWGCSPQEKPALKIGTITISPAEFERAFKSSDLASDKAEGRKKFLDRFIATRLILQEAVNEHMDTDPEFLYNVQMFWEQSLLKQMIAKKSKELLQSAKVDDKAIQQYYENNKEKYYQGKELAEVYDQVKWIVFKEVQNKAVEQWVDSLRAHTPIEIDYKRLKIESGR